MRNLSFVVGQPEEMKLGSHFLLPRTSSLNPSRMNTIERDRRKTSRDKLSRDLRLSWNCSQVSHEKTRRVSQMLRAAMARQIVLQLLRRPQAGEMTSIRSCFGSCYRLHQTKLQSRDESIAEIRTSLCPLRQKPSRLPNSDS